MAYSRCTLDSNLALCREQVLQHQIDQRRLASATGSEKSDSRGLRNFRCYTLERICFCEP